MRWGLLVLVATAMATSVSGANSSLEGYWTSNTEVERPKGIVTLRQSTVSWSAALNGVDALAEKGDGKNLHFHFRKENTQLRVTLGPNNSVVSAFWIQEGDQGQPLASPISLQKSNTGDWVGAVPELAMGFTLYTKIFKREDGTLIAAFRNPQRNTRGGASRLYVAQDGRVVRFMENNENKPGIVHTGQLSENGQMIQMPWPEIGVDISLSRVTEDKVPGFFPRPLGAQAYTYAVPEKTSDGWNTARPSESGLNASAVEGVIKQILAVDPASRQPNLIHSLLVAHNGKLVVEEYFYGHHRNMLHDTRSASKTFSSAMLGALMHNGTLIDEKTRVMPLLAAHDYKIGNDRKKESIAIAHLMTHTSGLACDDNDPQSPGNEDNMQSQAVQADWWAYTAALPMVHEPGQRYAYCSAGMNLVGAALSLKSTKWLPELFDDTIAKPLQFGRYAWNLAPNGAGYMGGGVRLLPRDLLKLGQLYLDKGMWNGTRVVSEHWAQDSTTTKIVIDEKTTGLDTQALQNRYPGGSDGYAWHIFDVKTPRGDFRTYEAAGNGGQMVIVVPSLNLVVAMTGGNYNQGFIWGRWRDEIVGKGLIPATVQ